ncbi:hypothetical protein HMPREF9141_0504 [Prevotella multiformis DSM 16608]|uniref:Uncharacterized protein n=1 Tax=Prevotella multiformis DSM 16608 TaxID=888743 RepID=F0F4I8_9BACT|nr:hypothetical protein HMPREF9141_0504 [Prevotella multiformis DSM 16608]
MTGSPTGIKSTFPFGPFTPGNMQNPLLKDRRHISTNKNKRLKRVLPLNA